MIEAEAIIRAEKVEKYYAQPSQNRIQVISATDLSIVPGEILALLGPIRLRQIDHAAHVDRALHAHRRPGLLAREAHRRCGDQRLHRLPELRAFPWLTVLENVEAPLQARGVSPDERRDRSMKMLDTVGLDGFEAAYPKELSGGMKQRVGFARALVVEPEVLFMDEPFSALDVLTAENLRSELLELWANKTMPTKAVFIVTHNIEEAVLLADRIIVLGRNPGHIRTDFRVQLAQPRDRKSEPFTSWSITSTRCSPSPTWPPPKRPISNRPQGARPAPDALPDAAPRPPRRHGRPARTAARQGRRDDIYRLADDLAFEIDDLLPIVDAAQLLGFLTIEEGDAAITPSGTEFANSEILRQKELFRDAAVENVLLLRQIRRALESKSDHTVPEDFFLDMLDEQFSEEECLRQMETAVAWGRYAELFDFDAGRRRFVLARRPGRRISPPARMPSEPSSTPSHEPSSPPAPGHFSSTWEWPPVGAGHLLRHRQHRRLLARQARPRGAHLALHRRAAGLRLLLHRAHRHRLPAQPCLRHQLRLHRRLQPAGRAWMIAVLDILQSIPVLSFLPPVVLAMVALVPGHQMGIEMGVILLIFTGQVWNLAFSFYSSLKSIPGR
jgi:NitT/TauT family transport system ATP-binding protein